MFGLLLVVTRESYQSLLGEDMVRRSLLGSSRQLWKLYLTLILIILGGFLLLMAVVNMERLTPESEFLLVFGAFLIIGLGLCEVVFP